MSTRPGKESSSAGEAIPDHAVPPSISLRPGHSVIVTGAGYGLGQGIAVAFAQNGARVIIAARRDNGAETEELIRSRGGDALYINCDVTDRAAVENVIRKTVERHGKIDTIVHNAVTGKSSDTTILEDADIDLWDVYHASVALRASYYLAHFGFPYLREARGQFISLVSPAGMEGSKTMPLYGASKAALRGFTKSLAREWAPLGINVTAISPIVWSGGMQRSFSSPHTPGHEERLRSIVPMGYIGDAEQDLGPTFVFLASEASRYVTGQTLPVDGGRFMSL